MTVLALMGAQTRGLSPALGWTLGIQQGLLGGGRSDKDEWDFAWECWGGKGHMLVEGAESKGGEVGKAR